uniref:Uncharacterized protein n=1 Tax=Parascaris univalens TaxID=6257 RepID=A0A915ALH7_PARUN
METLTCILFINNFEILIQYGEAPQNAHLGSRPDMLLNHTFKTISSSFTCRVLQSDSVYFSVPNMHNAFSGDLHPQISQPVETKYAVANAPKVELAESVHREQPQVATLITQDISSDTETAIETQLPKVFADSTYVFDADTETTAKLAEELLETQSNDDEQLVTVSPITDPIKTPISTGLQEVRTTYVGSEYNFEGLRGLEAFGAR